ncbi:MAG: HEAT repeat domain-containing protein [Gemmataceae bacterium]|nr:HEAT repeat domain-containing protein [Gemmataceae bacterium]
MDRFLLSALLLLGAERPEANGDAEAHLAGRLVAIVHDPARAHSVQARVAAARLLGEMGIGARSVVPQLALILDQPGRGFPLRLDEAVVAALGRMGAAARPAVPALVRNAGQDRDLDRAIDEAVAAIMRSGALPVPVEELARKLKDADAGERLRAAKRLALMGAEAKGAAPALAAALADEDGDVRRQAVLALRAIGPAPHLKSILGAHVRDLGDDDPAIRLGAAKSLASMGLAGKPAVPALEAAAKGDPDEDVRAVAAEAAARLRK